MGSNLAAMLTLVATTIATLVEQLKVLWPLIKAIPHGLLHVITMGAK